MARLEQYITEAGFNKQNFIEDREKLYYDLTKNAQPYRQEVGNRPVNILYRGSHIDDTSRNTEIATYTVKTPRTDRVPKDTPLNAHRAFDEVFYDDWGWRPRSEGVFATGWEDATKHYGMSFIFVPKGKFKYIWSDKVMDLTHELNWADRHISARAPQFEIEQWFKRAFADTYKDTDLWMGIQTKHEIMFKCSEFFLIGQLFRDVVKNFISGEPLEPFEKLL